VSVELLPARELPSWRGAESSDDAAICELSMALNLEDPGPAPVPVAHVHRTLAVLRAEPWRGRAVVLQGEERVLGYALLISFWSNELGGEVCTVDELYVVPAARGGGFGGSIFDLLMRGELWGRKPVALELETTPDNQNARRLYERNGFVGKNLSMRRIAVPSPNPKGAA
jgi:GNAT superfamily N-acetyltransferase